MNIRPAGREDLAAIAAIQKSAPEAAQWDPVEYLNYTCLVTEGGFLVTRPLAPGENEVLNLAVAPAARRRGIARQLLRHALEASPGDWFLEVRASNLAAIRLYESLGFEAAGHRPGYYRTSPEAAIVMRLRKCYGQGASGEKTAGDPPDHGSNTRPGVALNERRKKEVSPNGANDKRRIESASDGD